MLTPGRFAPCQLAWQVNQLNPPNQLTTSLSRPLPACWQVKKLNSQKGLTKNSGWSARALAHVATPETLARIRTSPPLPTPKNRVLASRLERHIECWQDCQLTMKAVADTLDCFLGIKADTTGATGVPLIFLRYRADIRKMRWRTWLWWVSVLSDTQITYVGDTVKITKREPNQEIHGTQ